MGVWLKYKSVYHIYDRYLQRPEEDIGSLGTGGKNDCEPLWRC